MKNSALKFLFVLIVIISSVSCSKKSESSEEVVISKETLAGSYKLTAATASGQDVYNIYLDACQRDDIYQLNADLTALMIDAGTKCSPPGDATGNWSLVGTTKIIIIGREADIVSYDRKTLVVTTMDNSTGFNLQVKLTFTRQ